MSLALVFLGVILVGASMCRLDTLHIRHHRLIVIVAYLAAAGMAAYVTVNVFLGGRPRVIDLVLLVTALAVSVYRIDDWAGHKAPQWAERKRDNDGR